jgi:hypothetical protein
LFHGRRLASAAGLAFLATMDLDTARHHIQAAVARLQASNRQPLFDEWAVLSLGREQRGVVAYSGPRGEAFRRNVAADAAPLLGRSKGKEINEGDIEFALDAAGTKYDAFMKVGPTSFLVLNHTAKTMAEIRTDAKWLTAQAVIFELGEKFRADPLEP